MRLRHVIGPTMGLLAGLAVGSQASAARELCVVCSGPDAVYRCQAPQERGEIAPPAPLACMTSIAQKGGHERCAVRRDASVCEGQEHVLAGDQGEEPARPRTALKIDEPPSEPRAPDTGRGEPKTVKELAERAAKGSSEQLRKAGDAVGKATRRTWDCVTSLFSAC